MQHPPRAAEFDVAVVGSGFGGSIAASRLARAGQRVLVLERGPWRDSLPVRSLGIARRSPFPYGRRAATHLLRSLHSGRWSLRLNRAGMFELFNFPGLRVLVSSAVGGGSTAWGGLVEPPRNPVLWQGRHPELDPQRIEHYYGKVTADLGAVRLSQQHPLPQSVWTHLPAATAQRCRPAEPQPHMALLLPPTRAEAGQTVTVAPGLQRQYCAFDGDSFLGSRGGAKATVDIVYLAPVLDRGVTVRDLCEVTVVRRARPVDGGGYLVEYTDLATRRASVVRAGRVVLAAGTLNTLRLLFASSGDSDGLGPMPALGRSFNANGDLMGLWWRTGTSVPSFVSTPSQGEFVVAGHSAATYGLGGLPGVETLPLPSFLGRRLARALFIYGMGPESGTAAVGWDGRRLRLRYDPQNEPVYAEIRAAFGVLAAESGEPTSAVGTPITVHPAGGACVGPDAASGVVDHRGEIHGHPGLFIADASILPAAVGGPPSLAIAAWAHYVADGIAASA